MSLYANAAQVIPVLLLVLGVQFRMFAPKPGGALMRRLGLDGFWPFTAPRGPNEPPNRLLRLLAGLMLLLVGVVEFRAFLILGGTGISWFDKPATLVVIALLLAGVLLNIFRGTSGPSQAKGE